MEMDLTPILLITFDFYFKWSPNLSLGNKTIFFQHFLSFCTGYKINELLGFFFVCGSRNYCNRICDRNTDRHMGDDFYSAGLRSLAVGDAPLFPAHPIARNTPNNTNKTSSSFLNISPF